MKGKKLYILFTLIVLLFSLIGCKKEALKQAPYFEIKDLNGNVRRLTDYKGKRLLLIFWGSWCPTCKDILKSLNEKVQELKSKNIEILAVSVDESENKAIEVLKEYNLNNLVVAIATPQMLIDYEGIRFLPTSYLIDGTTGTVIKKYIGEVNLREIESLTLTTSK
ncbi:MAG: peroxiredoxin family protein [Thermosulfidibacteraceae bacterium]|jgi:peroxiredoxin